MEEPQVIIKQEILESSTLTEPNVNYETQILEVPQIKLESVKLEPCFDISEDMSIPTNLNHQINLSEETKMIGNNPNNVLDSSLYKTETKQEDLDIKLEGSEEIEKIEDLVDEKWKVENDELNIKEDENFTDEEHRNSSKLALENQHEENTASSKKKIINGNSFTCDQCEYKTSKRHYLKMHLKKHKKPGIYKCDQCDYQTIHKRYLTKHSLKHKNPDEVDVHKCDQCNYQSVRKQCFKRHLEKHKNHVERVLYKCGQCDVNMQYQTFSKTNLRRHLLKHKQP